jgi:hypothetical protein
MADRYWVGGTGTWSSTNTANWSASSGGASGASVPTAADNVFFDANSNVGTGTFTVTMADTPRVCNDFTASGLDGTMTLAGTSIGLTVSGSLSFPATNFTRTYTGTTTFNATTTGKTITTNGVAFGAAVTLDGVGGEWTLGSALTMGATNPLTLNNGTFNTSASNYNVSAQGFASSNSNTRTITLNNSTLTFSTTGTAWSMATSTNATVNAGNSTISLSGGSPTFAGGGLTYYNVSFTSASATPVVKTITGANTFNNLTFSTISSAGLNNISIGADQTINGTLTVNGSNGNRRQFVRSSVIGTSRTLTCAAIAAMTDVDFRDITIAGAASPLSGTRLGDCGGNTNITFVAGTNKYWNLAAGGNWNATAWATSSGGGVADTNYPLPQDTAIIENTGLTAGNTITINGGWNIGTLDASTRTNAMTLASSTTTPTFYGNFTYGSGVTPTGTGIYTFSNRSTKTINSGGKTFTQPVTIDAPGGGIQLVTNDLTLGSTLTTTLTQGTLDLNNLTLTTGLFSSNNSNTRTIAFGTGNITCTGAGTVWNTATAIGLTTTGTQVVNVTSVGSSAILVQPGSLSETDAISFNFTGGTYALSNIFGLTSYAVRNLNFTGFAGTLNAIAGGIVYGNLTISTGMTVASANATLTFRATSGTQLITTNGKTLDFSITFNGIGGTFRLEDAFTMGSTRTMILTNGTLNLNGNTCTVGTRFTTATGTKNLTFNGGTLVCPDPNTTSFNNAAPTNFTTTAGTGTGTISMTAATAKTFVGGGSTYNCTLNQGGAGTLTITGANTFNDITNTNATASQITFPASTTTTVNAFTLSGSSGNLVSIRSSTPGTRFTLSDASGTVSVSFLDIQDSNATGGATWQAFTANGNVDSGNNLGWVFTAGNYVDAAASVTADATVTGLPTRIRLFAGDISASAAIASLAYRIRLFAGDITGNASVEGQGVRVRIASGDVTSNATVSGVGNITAGGAASVTGFADVSAYASATYSFKPVITATADVVANGQIVGEEWGDTTPTSSTWTTSSPEVSGWSNVTGTSSTWLRQ